ncbi:hypothetical protein O181_023318 [Austropuccinia psidii MF-1]|uniref:Uncharacterized protein n=1 Tax=Austropuccinia psidii MF-1 TaxID=1389203 RepID=A0A9Q3CGU6_9BASI|nr:hypothetical protein [Austropuccinia psidii MF-1]
MFPAGTLPLEIYIATMHFSSNLIILAFAFATTALAHAEGDSEGMPIKNVTDAPPNPNKPSMPPSMGNMTDKNTTATPDSEMGASTTPSGSSSDAKIPGDMSTGKCLCPAPPTCPTVPTTSSPSGSGNSSSPPAGSGSTSGSGPGPSSPGAGPNAGSGSGSPPPSSPNSATPPPPADNSTSAANSPLYQNSVSLVALLAASAIGLAV